MFRLLLVSALISFCYGGAVELQSGFLLEDTTTPQVDSGCFFDNATGSTGYIGGNIFGDKHFVNSTSGGPEGCCALCQQYAAKGCVFWTYDSAGCYGTKDCCRLKSAVAWAGRVVGPPSQTSGSIKPFPECRDGVQCGGTGLWTQWGDTSLPDSKYTNPGTMPYPQSKDLVGWAFKSGCNPGYGSGNYVASSADTFLPTWAADNKLYTGFTDGDVHDDVTGQFIHASSEGDESDNVIHGQTAIVGDDPFALKFTEVNTFTTSGSPYGGRFPSGSLVYNGTWWYGTYYVPTYPSGPLVGGLLGPTVDFRHSTDFGKTWNEPRVKATSASDNLWGEEGETTGIGPKRVKFGNPHWVDFGQELEHSPDGKAYIVAHGATDPNSTEMWGLGDQVYMARVSPTIEAINDGSSWEFYAGGHGAGAKWVAGDVSQAVPLVEWTNHCGSSTMTYFPGIQKYVLSIQTTAHYPIMDGGDFDTYFLESDDITGPWSYVTYMKSFGPQVYFPNYPTKFSAKQADTSAKTFEAFLLYSANYDPHSHTPNPPNSGYHMNLQQARFDLSSVFAAKLEAEYAAERHAARAY